MATFVLLHGGWHGGWCWRKVAKQLRDYGHDVFTPTFTGMGEREHLWTPETGLSVHQQDVLNLIRCEQLNQVILVGHSYGGAIMTLVADDIAHAIEAIVYVDAIIPEDGVPGWFGFPELLYLAPMPVIALILFFVMRKDLKTEREYRPFLLTVALFLMGYIGVCFALFPYIVPYQMTIYDAAAADTSLSFMLIGAVIMLPIILSYTAFAYYTFKGKTDHNPMY